VWHVTSQLTLLSECSEEHSTSPFNHIHVKAQGISEKGQILSYMNCIGTRILAKRVEPRDLIFCKRNLCFYESTKGEAICLVAYFLSYHALHNDLSGERIQ
jgi:hypothetical protein